MLKYLRNGLTQLSARAALALGVVLVMTASGLAANTTVFAQESDADSGEVRIAARRVESGGVEFALQVGGSGGSWGDRRLPRVRFLPADATVDRWLASSPLQIGAGEVRIAARRVLSGGVEFALQVGGSGGSWGDRRLPRVRFLPADATVDRWLSSSPLLLAEARSPENGNNNLLYYTLGDSGNKSLWSVTPEGIRARVGTDTDFRDAAFSPDGRWVAYSDGSWQFPGILLNIERGESRRLGLSHTDHSAISSSFSNRYLFSPDSKFIAYAHEGAVWVEQLDGDYRHRVPDINGTSWSFSDDSKYFMIRDNHRSVVTNVNTGSKVIILGPAQFVPGSSRVYYYTFPVDPGADVGTWWTMNADGSNKQKVVHDGRTIAWSADGTLAGYKGPTGNWFVATQTGEVIAEIPDSGSCETVYWDGSKRFVLDYSLRMDIFDIQGMEIETIRPAGQYSSEYRRLSVLNAERSNLKIAYARRNDSDSSRPFASFWVANFDGTNEKKLFGLMRDFRASDYSDVGRMVWSPRGKYIAIQAIRETGDKVYVSIWIFDTGNGGGRKIIEAERKEAGSFWWLRGRPWAS